MATSMKKIVKKAAKFESKKSLDGAMKFPDKNGDGKITKKDILIARGIIPSKKKK
jgi:hypothetical protein